MSFFYKKNHFPAFCHNLSRPRSRVLAMLLKAVVNWGSPWGKEQVNSSTPMFSIPYTTYCLSQKPLQYAVHASG